MHSQYRRRRPANSSTIVQQILNEDTEPTKKRNYRFARISCYGYRKQVWRLGVFLWVLTFIGIFCCFGRIDGSWKFLCSFSSPGVLKFAVNKKLEHYENAKYGDVYDWGNEANNDERRNYPGITSSLSDQKPIFTGFTEKDSEKLMGMKKSFEEAIFEKGQHNQKKKALVGIVNCDQPRLSSIWRLWPFPFSLIVV